MTVKVVNRFYKPSEGELCLDTYSRGKTDFEKSFSPFLLGPVYWAEYDTNLGMVVRNKSKNFENFWQFKKVYPEHIGDCGEPSQEYYKWSKAGFEDSYAHRFPMGKGRKPAYSWWNGERLDYVEARKKLYGPYYLSTLALTNTENFIKLQDIYRESGNITLRDPDGYDHRKLGMSYSDVLNCPTRKCGHGMFLAMYLEADKALDEILAEMPDA